MTLGAEDPRKYVHGGYDIKTLYPYKEPGDLNMAIPKGYVPNKQFYDRMGRMTPSLTFRPVAKNPFSIKEIVDLIEQVTKTSNDRPEILWISNMQLNAVHKSMRDMPTYTASAQKDGFSAEITEHREHPTKAKIMDVELKWDGKLDNDTIQWGWNYESKLKMNTWTRGQPLPGHKQSEFKRGYIAYSGIDIKATFGDKVLGTLKGLDSTPPKKSGDVNINSDGSLVKNEYNKDSGFEFL